MQYSCMTLMDFNHGGFGEDCTILVVMQAAVPEIFPWYVCNKIISILYNNEIDSACSETGMHWVLATD